MTQPNPATPPADDDAVDAILADCLDVPRDQLPAAVAAACERHPALADDLRRRAEALLSLHGSMRSAGAATHPGQLDRFRLLQPVGGGGMGMVYLAVEEPLQRRVALKVIRLDLLFFPGARQRFLREVAAIAALDHPGIVPIHAYGEDKGVPYYAMPLVEGRSLAAVLQELRGRDPARLDPARLGQPAAANWSEACAILAQKAAVALQHAHERGVVHRDIKPSNLMLTPDGRVLVIDFGLAQLDDQEQLTKSGSQPGSPAYMAPEQLRGGRVDARTDVYALGVVLYELLTLQPAWSDTTEQGLRQRVLNADAVPIRHRNRKAPQDLITAVATAMAPEPGRRYQTAALLAGDLDAWLHHRPIAARPAGPLLRLRRFVQRRPTLVATAAAALLLVVVLPTALLLQERTARLAIERQKNSLSHVVQSFASMFAEAEPSRARGASVPVRTILDAGVRRVREDLRDEPAARAVLLDELGAAYMTLGLFADCEPLLLEAQRLHGNEDPAGRDRNQLLRAQLLLLQGRAGDARPLLLDLVQRPDAHAGDDAARIDARLKLANAERSLGQLAAATQQYEAAIDASRQHFPGTVFLAQALQQQAAFTQAWLERPDDARLLLDEAWDLAAAQLQDGDPRLIALQVERARVARALGEADTAERLLQQALAAGTRVLDPHHPQLAQVREELASFYLANDHPAEALPLAEQVVAAYAATHQPPHPLLAGASSLEAGCALEVGDLAHASRTARAALAMYEALPEKSSHEFASALVNLARVHIEMGELADGVQLARRALAMLQELELPSPQTAARAHAWLGRALALSHQWREGWREVDTAVELAGKVHLPPPSLLPQLQILQALVYLECGEGAAATAPAQTALEGFLALHEDGAGVGMSRFALGWAANMRGDAKAAEPLLRESARLLGQCYGESHPFFATVTCELGVALARQGRLQDAAPLFRQAYAVQSAAADPDCPFLVVPAINLAFLQQAQSHPADACRLAMQVLAIQQRHHLLGDLRTPMAIDLALQTLDAEPSRRQERLLLLQQAATAALPEGHKLRQKIAAAIAH